MWLADLILRFELSHSENLNQVIRGQARSLPDGCAQSIIVDPPYNIGELARNGLAWCEEWWQNATASWNRARCDGYACTGKGESVDKDLPTKKRVLTVWNVRAFP